MSMRKGFKWFIGLLVLGTLGYLAVYFVGLLLGGFGEVRADTRGDEIIQSNDQNVVTSGDIAVGTGDSRALAFGHALGDVDIAQCLGSVQWDTILVGRQKLVLNNVCMAEFYLKNGMFDLAAMMLCNQPEILDEFDSEESCEVAHNFTPPEPVPEPTVSSAPPLEEVVVEHYEEEQMLHEQQQMEFEAIEDRLARIEHGQRAAARAAQERREFAQMTLDKLVEPENDPEE